MPVIINHKATSWRKKIILVIVSLIIFLVNDILICIVLALALNMSDHYRKLDFEEYPKFIEPIEMLLWFPMNMLTTVLIFAYT